MKQLSLFDEPSEQFYASEIYAELSRQQMQMVLEGDYEIEVPYGVTMSNKHGSRILRFACDSREASVQLTEGLDVSGIVWQEDGYAEDE